MGFQWGIDRDPDKDDTVLKGANGSAIKVFDASDNWQIPEEEQQRVAAEKKAADRCTTEDPMSKLPADMVLYSWQNGSSTGQYWVRGFEGKRLFTVKSYEFLERYYVPDKKSLTGVKPNASAFKFRVESTTQGRFPISHDWYLNVLLSDGECKVYDVQEAN